MEARFHPARTLRFSYTLVSGLCDVITLFAVGGFGYIAYRVAQVSAMYPETVGQTCGTGELAVSSEYNGLIHWAWVPLICWLAIWQLGRNPAVARGLALCSLAAWLLMKVAMSAYGWY